jgi:hypothetical protein
MIIMKRLNQTVERGRGRPVLPEHERKRARNLSVSDLAWAGLEEQVKRLGCKTVSELIEKIGLKQVQMSRKDVSELVNETISDQVTSELADIAISRRLTSLISEPVAVFGSILAFVTRICQQFALEATADRMYAVTMKACTVVFYVGYTHPDTLINNPSALIRWLCYRIVQAEAEHYPSAPADSSEAVDPQVVERYFHKIGMAFQALEGGSRSPDYEALKMKTMDGLTIKQISRIFQLQKLKVSKAEVSTMIKQGLVNFRKSIGAELDEAPPTVDFSRQNQTVSESIHRYLQLALQRSLRDVAAQKTMEAILLETGNNPYLDFWLNEIDYALGKQEGGIGDRIAKNLDEYLLTKKTMLDQKLTFCGTRDQIRTVLQTLASKEAGTELQVEILLGEWSSS